VLLAESSDLGEISVVGNEDSERKERRTNAKETSQLI